MTLTERFERKFTKRAGNCWEWTASKDKKGYGRILINKVNRCAHRVAWELYRGPIPAGLHVLHRCDNPSCVNPDHLFLGTNKDNVDDKMSKERWAGPDQPFRPSAKLTEKEISLIRQDPRTLERIAKDYGVSISNVSMIKNFKTWKD